MKKICTLGGGTGSFTVLRALKQIDGLEVAAIVAMSDNGGSTGVLRDEYGVLPPGDVRQCLVALSPEEHVLRKLFTFRYESGTFQGHSFGNLFLSTLEKITGDFEQAISEAAKILHIRGEVIPITTENIHLKLDLSNGQKIIGEDIIQSMKFPEKGCFKVSLSPKPSISITAKKKLLSADFIIIGPGNLYCSLLPVLLPEGIKEVFRQTSAKIIYVANLMQSPLHTDGYTLQDYLDVIQGAIGRQVDNVLVNQSAISPSTLERYFQLEQSTPIYNDLPSNSKRLLTADIISDHIESPKSGDLLRRTLIRHDSIKLAKVLSKIFS